MSHQICDSCVHQHIVSTLNSCLISSVTCPKSNCGDIISPSVICNILSKYNNDDLLNKYLREQNWKGKSEEWIRRFTARCPGCNVPIQKNGGCIHMICSRCRKHFYWPKLPTLNDMTGEYICCAIVLFIHIIIVVSLLLYILYF
jgi:hypothetical protein